MRSTSPPPFCSRLSSIPRLPPPLNYGAIGTIIGHEISHTFDSEGSAFDSKGRVRNWWTPDDLAHFERRHRRLAAQYDTYKPFPDLARQRQANPRRKYRRPRWHRRRLRRLPRLARTASEAPTSGRLHRRPAVLHRLRAELGSQIREAALRQQVLTDPHAPASTAPTPSATTTAGTPPSISNPQTSSTSPPTTASASGNQLAAANRKAAGGICPCSFSPAPRHGANVYQLGAKPYGQRTQTTRAESPHYFPQPTLNYGRGTTSTSTPLAASALR